MINKVDESLVLRSVYLPKQLDSEIKTIAIAENKQKNDIIRDLLTEAIIARKRKKKNT